MKRLCAYLYILGAYALPLRAQDSLELQQLPPTFSLRTLNKVCQQQGLKEDLAQRYAHAAGGVQAIRSKLRHEMRAHMLARSLALEKKMAYFYAHQTFPQVHFPSHCPRLNRTAWEEIAAQQRTMRETETHLRRSVTLRRASNMRVLLRVSYELMFIKHILRRGNWHRLRSRNWQHPPFWSRDVGRIEQLAFPPIYPIALEKMQFGYPQQRLELLYEKFPLLRWRSLRHFDVRGRTLAHELFVLAFVNGHHEGVMQRLEFDFARKLRPLMAKVDEFSNNIDAIKIKTIKNKEIVLNKGQITNLRALQFYFMFALDSDVEKYIDNLSDDTLYQVARLVDRTYIDWVATQQDVRDNACHGQDFEIEEYRLVLWSLLNSYTKEDSLDLLAAFCHPSWGRTSVRMTEAWSQAAYGTMFAAGFLIKKIRPQVMPLASVTAAFSFLMRSVRGIKSLQAERSLLLLDEREENSRIYNNTFNIVAIPISFWGIGAAARAITSSWNKFIPFYNMKSRGDLLLSLDLINHFSVARYTDIKSHLDRGINPITSKNFMLNSVDNLLGAYLRTMAIGSADGGIQGRFKNTAALSLTYALLNIYVQNIYFLLWRDDITIENHKFNNMWGVFHSGPRNVVDWTLWHYLRGKVNHSTVPTAVAIGSLMSVARVLDGWQKKVWYANSKLAYLKEDKSFFEAFAELNLDEYREPLKLGAASDKEIKIPSLAAVESLAALLRLYEHENEKTHLLIDIDRFYRQAWPAR